MKLNKKRLVRILKDVLKNRKIESIDISSGASCRFGKYSDIMDTGERVITIVLQKKVKR